MHRPVPDSSRRGPFAAGFSLVEVTLALGIAAFCLVLLLGLLPTGLGIIQRGVEEATAIDRASAVLADVKATPLTDSTGQPTTVTMRYGLDLTGASSPAGSPLPEFLLDEQGNKLSAADAGQARYRVGYRIPTPPAPPSGTSAAVGRAQGTRVYLRVSWPGPATAARASGLVEFSVIVDRNE